MGIAQLFFKEKNLIKDIEIDVIIREGAAASARITKNPVENGADMNDHVIIDPMTFSMEGVVSNASIGIIAGLQTIGSLFASQSKSEETWEKLLDLHASKTLFTLVQGLKSYPNALLQSIREVQDKDTSKALFFTASFTALNIVGLTLNDPDQFSDQDTSDEMVDSTNGGLKQMGEEA